MKTVLYLRTKVLFNQNQHNSGVRKQRQENGKRL